MSFSLNKIQLIGNLGQDAEHRVTTSNKTATSFSIATVESYKAKDGNWVNNTTWHNIVAWELSDFLKDKLVKGAKFYVEGRLSKREYDAKDGGKKLAVEVVAGFGGLIPLDKPTTEQSSGVASNKTVAQADNTEEPDSDLPF